MEIALFLRLFIGVHPLPPFLKFTRSLKRSASYGGGYSCEAIYNRPTRPFAAHRLASNFDALDVVSHVPTAE